MLTHLIFFLFALRAGTARDQWENADPFSNPVLNAAGNYVLTTELGGSRFRLETRRDTVLDQTLDNRKIYGTDLVSDGTVALILNSPSQSYLSELRVIGADGKERFSYASSRFLFTDVALSANGRQLAAVGTTAENGVLQSVLSVFSLPSGTMTEHTGSQVLLHRVSFLSGGAVLAVGDEEVWSLRAGADQPDVFACNGLTPVGSAVAGNLAGVALSHDGSTEGGTVWVFGGNGDRTREVPFEGAFRSLTADRSLLLLSDTGLYTLAADGSATQTDVPSDALCAVEYGGSPLLLTLSDLRRLS